MSRGDRLPDAEGRSADLTGIVDANIDAMLVIDRSGRIRFANRAAQRLLGRDLAMLTGAPFGASATAGRTSEIEVLDPAGNAVVVEMQVADTVWEGRPVSLASLRDVTDRKRAEEALRESNERFQSAFDGAPIGVALVGLGEHARGRLLQVNPVLCELVGYASEQLTGRTMADLVFADDAAGVTTLLAGFAEASAGRFERELRCVHADGHPIWVRLHASTAVRDAEGTPVSIVVHLENVTERKLVREQLVHRASHDPLTGLANRNLLAVRLQHALDRLDRAPGAAVAVLYVDLDDFKSVNDRLGHDAGDRYLAEVGRRIGQVVRLPDTAARVGGDEFVVVAVDLTQPPDAVGIVRRVQAALAAPITIGGDTWPVSASIGVVITRDATDDPADLLQAADEAMYTAKQHGHASYEIFDDTIRAHVTEREGVEDDLRHALGEHLLRVHYQPIFDLADGSTAGVEALVRLQHPRRGLLLPEDFLDVAESTGLIVPIGEWVIAAACRQQVSWQAGLARPLEMAVNVSARQVLHGKLDERIFKVLDATGIDPAQLTLELAETFYPVAGRSYLAELDSLRSRGVHFALDDFGTGHTSLPWLQRFPVDTIKINADFVAGLGKNATDTNIVGAIVQLAHALDAVAVAEGVETPAQLAELRRLGCDRAQGFYLARPDEPERVSIGYRLSRPPS